MTQANVDSSFAQVETLTSRELEVLGLFAQGHSNKRVAAKLSIPEQTVKAHAKSVFRKLSVTNRVQAILFYQRQT